MKKIILAVAVLLAIPYMCFADSEVTIGGKTGAAHIIQDEGTSLRPRSYLNFTGSVECTDSSGKTVCNVTGGGGAGGAGNTFLTWTTPSGTSPVADSTTDTVTFTDTHGIVITGTAGSDEIDFGLLFTGEATVDTVGGVGIRANHGGSAHHTATVAGDLDHGGITGLGDDDHSTYENELDNSAGLLGALSDETGTGVAVFDTSPSIDSPTFTTDITAVDLLDFTELSDTMTLDTDTSISFGASGLTFIVANPASDAVDINGTGAFGNDLLHIHQHTGNPTGGNLIHAEAEDADISPLIHVESFAPDTTASDVVSLLIDTDVDDDTDFVPIEVRDDNGANNDLLFRVASTGQVLSDSLTVSEILGTDASKNIISLAVATYPSLAELAYVKGVTSAIQTQIDAQEAELTNFAGLAGALNDETGTVLAVFNTAPTFETSITGNYLTASEILITGASKEIVSAPVATYPSLAELAYLKGASSAIQTQITNNAALVDTDDELIAIINASPSTQIKHEAGGLEADVNGYTGYIKISGGSTSNVAEDSSGLCAAGLVCTGGHEHAGASLTDDIFALHAGDSYTGEHDMNGATFEPPNSASDVALADAGNMHLNTTDEQLSFHSAADGEISGEASISLLRHLSLTVDPGAWYDSDAEIFLFTIKDDSPEGIVITEWISSCNADPDVEINADLRYADAWIGLANAADIDEIDTTNGTSSEDTNANINGGAAVATSKVVYIGFDADPEGTCVQWNFEMWFYNEED